MKNLLIIFSFLTLAPLAVAQPMQGMRDVGLVIERLDEEAIRCNITTDLIDASVRVLLANSRIRLVRNESALNPYLYVRATVFEASGNCIIAVEMTFNKYVQSERAVGAFWNKGDLMTRRSINSASAVADSIERMTKQFIAAWLREN